MVTKCDTGLQREIVLFRDTFNPSRVVPHRPAFGASTCPLSYKFNSTKGVVSFQRTRKVKSSTVLKAVKTKLQ